MRVLITGGAGHIGKATTRRFVEEGWTVRAIGLESGIDVPGVEFVTCDILDFDGLRRQAHGCQAVIHLAALRGPQLAPGHKIVEVNAGGTFNVFQAAAAEGITRVVQASSINAFGCMYNLGDIAPQYFPVDEDHPVFTTDPYSYSKELVEDIGRYFWRRDGITSVVLRFPEVFSHAFLQSEEYRQRRERMYEALNSLEALSNSERQTQLAAIRQNVLEWRKRRPLEFTDRRPEPLTRKRAEEPLWYAYALDRFNLWACLDVEDAAQSLVKGATAAFDGAHTLFVNDHHNWLGYDSKTLVRFFFPEVAEVNINVTGSAALVSIDKARALIGFDPEYSVVDWK